ncbi:uncharacterized protein LOC129295029 [Prosopis cineraria]|uniref:uncharacterized protein LOC129295029 n=1 Tax=Prosopis cineraria TaxID=364024 RepID=UPI002410B129|nr:uncharacterized protein LOC129295029 [Prosopis cineraria]
MNFIILSDMKVYGKSVNPSKRAVRLSSACVNMNDVYKPSHGPLTIRKGYAENQFTSPFASTLTFQTPYAASTQEMTKDLIRTPFKEIPNATAQPMKVQGGNSVIQMRKAARLMKSLDQRIVYERLNDADEVYLDDGDATYPCEHCKAKMWFSERLKRASTKSNSVFSTCCCHEVYTIEFQKCGLLHAHIILFLEDKDKLKNPEEVIFLNKDRENASLTEINKMLMQNGRSLDDFPMMAKPECSINYDNVNNLMMEELSFDTELYIFERYKFEQQLTIEQREIYEKILSAVNLKEGSFFFVYGFKGTGKTFLWNALTVFIRSQKMIVLNVASSGIAATLLPSGRTAHSQFCIPINVTEDSTCNIMHGSAIATLIQITDLIVWDEAPMVKKHYVEAFDRTMKDIMRDDRIFGGKVVVFGGDFRQILPVLPGGDRADVVNASLNSSYLWYQCKIFKLTKKMRLYTTTSSCEMDKITKFSKWLLSIGDGDHSSSSNGKYDITIPEELLITDFSDPLQAIVDSIYPKLCEKYNEPQFFIERAILAPTLQITDYSSDSFDDIYDTEFLNTIKGSGLAPYKLTLKVGVPIMLMRNIDQANGLCNGTRLRVTLLGDHFIKGIILNGSKPGEEVYIHRMDLNPSECNLSFQMKRRQFPCVLSFVMTINKNQGQSLSNVGVYLPKPVFSHDQLYVAFSRVRSMDGLKILIHDEDFKPKIVTTNVVFKEVFQNLQ